MKILIKCSPLGQDTIGHTLETFNEIQNFINSAYPTVETRPSVHFMSSIWNWKDLIKQNLNNISHHSGPR